MVFSRLLFCAALVFSISESLVCGADHAMLANGLSTGNHFVRRTDELKLNTHNKRKYWVTKEKLARFRRGGLSNRLSGEVKNKKIENLQRWIDKWHSKYVLCGQPARWRLFDNCADFYETLLGVHHTTSTISPTDSEEEQGRKLKDVYQQRKSHLAVAADPDAFANARKTLVVFFREQSTNPEPSDVEAVAIIAAYRRTQGQPSHHEDRPLPNTTIALGSKRSRSRSPKQAKSADLEKSVDKKQAVSEGSTESVTSSEQPVHKQQAVPEGSTENVASLEQPVHKQQAVFGPPLTPSPERKLHRSSSKDPHTQPPKVVGDGTLSTPGFSVNDWIDAQKGLYK